MPTAPGFFVTWIFHAHRHCEERKRRSNPFFIRGLMDCFAALAMTLTLSLLQPVVHSIIGIAHLLAAIKGGPVVGRQRKSFSETARQVRIGNEDAAERNGVGMTRGNPGFGALPAKTAGCKQEPPPARPGPHQRPWH